jgi:hypothetical protein
VSQIQNKSREIQVGVFLFRLKQGRENPPRGTDLTKSASFATRKGRRQKFAHHDRLISYWNIFNGSFRVDAWLHPTQITSAIWEKIQNRQRRNPARPVKIADRLRFAFPKNSRLSGLRKKRPFLIVSESGIVEVGGISSLCQSDFRSRGAPFNNLRQNGGAFWRDASLTALTQFCSFVQKN